MSQNLEPLAQDATTEEPEEHIRRLNKKIKFLEGEERALSIRVREMETENRVLVDENKQNLRRSFQRKSSSCFGIGTWIPAELDLPSETTKSNAISYDPKQSSVSVRNVYDIRRDGGGYYAKLPSRTSQTIHVFIESKAHTIGSYRRLCVLPHSRVPVGFVSHSTIHLKRLGLRTRLGILIGKIERVYIISDTESLESKLSTNQPSGTSKR
ncbi:hypothetical protein BCR34DRAFT_661251 [Clohesyomyces aquaticus]|uniref:Uncharacterized protein n=1 Tax=Clohesyomyces aquaticus TaxID=1231657 RepID=A0A1Y2A3W0_9PLEO|nr:hypothetical protein BCR34DRAFT_661251 [Clohesyomyces aquaticus]